MSMARQIWLLITITLLLAFTGGFGISIGSSREFLTQQVSARSNDMAQSLALSLSQQRADPAAMELLLAAQFDTGFYDSIRLTDVDGAVRLDRHHTRAGGDVPQWFRRAMNLTPEPGVAQVTDGWQQLGRVEVRATTGHALEHLWQSACLAGGLFLVLILTIGLLAHRGLRVVMRPLMATVEQANALGERRFVSTPEPRTPELRDVTRAMNSLVARIKTMFDEQAVQVEALYQQAHCDTLTGLFNRQHFLARAGSTLSAEDGAAQGSLFLVRVLDPNGVNRALGRAGADALLREAAAVLSECVQDTPDALPGRLNGFDFALLVPNLTRLSDFSQEIVARLRLVTRSHSADVRIVIGAVGWECGAALPSLLAAADQALARAELLGPFGVDCSEFGAQASVGEDVWRRRLQAALQDGWHELIEFPLLDRRGALIHFECPLRLRLEAGAPVATAAQWLPMACRTGLASQLDLAAVRLALLAIERDGVARGVNISAFSLASSVFLPGLRRLLEAHRPEASKLWLEMPETGGMEHLTLLRELAALSHAFGARVGLEHAGKQIHEASAILEAGLDFVKLDASLIQGVGGAESRRQHLTGLCHLLHGVGMRVYAEGVADATDLDVLGDIGLDGWTGPAVAYRP
jgi:EAL domain-containing protein (putative c-di-GMP-specific phosphodiesterase class I)/GGDEF domain-containing protein